MIDILQRELIEQIALMDRMDLHAIHSCLLQQQCALGKRRDIFFNLFLCQRSGRNFIAPAIRRRRSSRTDLIKIHNRLAERAENRIHVQLLHCLADRERSSESCCQLNKQLRTSLMKFRHPLCKILIHLLVGIQPLSEHRIVDWLAARKHQPGTISRHL